jgi:hypothetical protein
MPPQFQYTLETFTEMRSTTKGSEPYSIGQFLEKGGFDEANFNVEIWELPCDPRGEFTEEVRMFEVPGTSELTVSPSRSQSGHASTSTSRRAHPAMPKVFHTVSIVVARVRINVNIVVVRA